MIFTKIWERYFLKQTIQSFLFFILGFYGLYVLIDYSSHASSFHYNHIHFRWVELSYHYFCEFSARMDVLIPFALLIATIHTLTNLNVHNELVALLASGINLHKLMRPFLFLALFFTLLLYANTEWLFPAALREIKQIDNTHTRHKNRTHSHASVQNIALEDGSSLIFQNYDLAQQYFFDAYWISSIHDIYHIKYLYPYVDKVTGFYIDHFSRGQNGELEIKESFQEKEFPSIVFNKEILFETITPAEEQAPSELLKKLPGQNQLQSEKDAQIASSFYYKLLMPWLCLFAVIGPAPFCLRFTRSLPVFFIYAFSIFGLVGFYLFMDAAFLLGKRQVISPLVAILTPFLSLGGILGWRFFFMK